MQAADYVQYIAEQIHTVVLAAADERGLPAACARLPSSVRNTACTAETV